MLTLRARPAGDEVHHKDLSYFSQGQSQDLIGKIEKFALSSDEKLLAIYANAEQGDLIVCKSDLSQ